MKEFLNNELAQEIRLGKVAFFIGAGISMDPPSNLPNANEIIKTLVTWASFPTKKAESLINKLSSFRLEYIVGEMPDEVIDGVLALLNSAKPNNLHFFLAEALLAGNTILTTNFDYLIETACESLGSHPQVHIPFMPEYFTKPKSWNGLIIKLHGSLQSKNIPHTAIIDFRMFGETPHLPIETAECLDELSQQKKFIFLGYSGSDDFDLMPKLLSMRYVYPPIWIQHTNERSVKLIKHKSLKLNSDIDLLIKSKNGNKLFANTRFFLDQIALTHKDLFSRVPNIVKDKRDINFKLEVLSEKHSLGAIRDTLRAKLFFVIEDFNEALLWLDQCRFDLFSHDYEGHIKNYNLMMGILQQIGMYNQALHLLERAERLCNQSTNEISSHSLAQLNLSAAKIYIGLKEHDMAKSFLERMMKRAPEINDEKDRSLIEGRFYGLMAAIKIEESKFEDALQDLDKAYKILTPCDPEGAYRCFSDKGLVLFRAGLNKEALTYWEIVLSYYKKVGKLQEFAKIKANCGFAFAKIGQYEKAIEFLEDSLAYLEKILPTKGSFVKLYYRLAILHWNFKRSKKSVEYIKVTKIAAKEQHDLGLLTWCDIALNSIKERVDIEEQC